MKPSFKCLNLPLYLLLLCFLKVVPAACQSDLSIDHRFRNKPLITVLNKIELDYGLKFAYDVQLLDPIVIGKSIGKNTPVDNFLQNLLTPHGLDFEIIDQKFVIIKKAQEVLEKRITSNPTSIKQMICGTIVDSLIGQPLPFSTVLLTKSARGVATDEKAYFSLEGPFHLPDTLQIRYIGYRPKHIAVRDLINQPCQSIQLSRQEFVIPDVLIIDQAVELLEASENGQGNIFKPEKMTTLPGWGDNDILRMVQLLPGIHASNESASALHIRGGTPDQNLILWDRIPVYHIDHFFGLFSAFNPLAARDIEVYKGGFGAKFGGRISGVLDISGKPSQLDTIKAEIGSNLINAHGYLSYPIIKDRVAIMVAGRRSFTDVIQSSTYQKLFNQVAGKGKIKENERNVEQQNINDILLDPVFYFDDINLKLLARLDDKNEFSVSLYRGEDNLNYKVHFDDFGIFLDTKDQITLNNWGLSSKWDFSLTESLSSSLGITYSSYANQYDVAISLDKNLPFNFKLFQTNEMRDVSIDWSGTLQLNRNHRFTAGFQRSELGVNYRVNYQGHREDQFFSISERLQGEVQTVFGDYDLLISNWLSADLGIRYSNYSNPRKSYWEPRFTLVLHPFNNNIHLRFNTGRYIQFAGQMVNYNELGLGEELWILANEKLSIPPLTSTQRSLGLSIDEKGWFFEVELYRKEIKNLSSLNLRFEDTENNPFFLGSGTVDGLDVLLKKRWRSYSSWLAYAYGKVRYQFDQIDQGLAFSAAHDQRHTLGWTHLLNLQNWDFSLTWNFHTGKPFTPANGIDEVIEENQEKSYQVNYGNRNESRLPNYHRLDISGNYEFDLGNRAKAKLGISIFNLYNRQNTSDIEFVVSTNRNNPTDVKLLQIERELLGFTPNLFFSISW